MKKMMKYLCVLLCVLMINCLALTIVHAEELEGTEETTSIIGQVYTYKEDKNYTFTILDETNVECVISDETQSVTILMQYTYADYVLTITMFEEPIGDFIVGADNVLKDYWDTVLKEPDVEEPTEEPVIEDESEEEITYPCNVSLSYIENGKVTFSKENGEVGELVEVYTEPSFLYDLVEIKVNGVVLTADESGIYSFALVEGENIVSVKFEVSNEKLEQVANLLKKAKEGSWEEIFTVSNLMQLISWLITLGCSSGFFVTLYKSRKYKQITPFEIAKQVDDKINSVLDDKLSSFLSDTFGPFNTNMLEKFSNMENSTKTMVRCFILMQENTPESRLAILKELNNLDKNETSALTTQVKELIAKEVKKQEAENKALSETLEELKIETSTVTHL